MDAMTAPHIATLEELAAKWERERATAHPADAMLINKKIRELRETIAAIALMRGQSEPVCGLERIDGMEFYLHENVDDGDAEPVRLVMAMSHNNKVFCHRATQADNGICANQPKDPADEQ